jgi:hypothetical protein
MLTNKQTFDSIHIYVYISLGYLKLDVFQLADVFESFRDMALEQDGLDPVNYYSVPGLTWDSAFKMTEAKIHLLQVNI